MPLIKKDWLPSCSMKRVICHWTAGAHRASELDKAHYHILIEKDGKLVRGTHSIEDNVSTSDGVYAAHTLGANTGSIGVSVCSMAGAVESPFSPGSNPMLEVQWRTMSRVVAELCRFYQIKVTPQTVLGHGEVQVNLGIEQKGKWDPMVLPWDTSMSHTQVGDFFRSLVQNFLDHGEDETEETPASVTILLHGKKLTDAFIANENAFLSATAANGAFGWTVQLQTGNDVVMRIDGQDITLPALVRDGEVYFGLRELVTALSLKGSWDPKTRTVTIP
jgi:hypothetical protein